MTILTITTLLAIALAVSAAAVWLYSQPYETYDSEDIFG